MQLTKFSDYALRTLMMLASSPEPSSIDALASSLDVSAHHLGKVVLFLSDAGYVRTRRGRGGGVELARAADAIHVGEVVRATERGAPLVPCFDGGAGDCNLAPTCRLKGALVAAEEAFFTSLDPLTIAGMVAPRATRATLVRLRTA